MNRICKNCNQYYINNCYCSNKFNDLNCKINNIYCKLYQTGCALDGISKACNIGKIWCGVRNLIR